MLTLISNLISNIGVCQSDECRATARFPDINVKLELAVIRVIKTNEYSHFKKSESTLRRK